MPTQRREEGADEANPAFAHGVWLGEASCPLDTMLMESPAAAYPFADLALARRLETAEGKGNIAFVAARTRLMPGVGSCWMEAAGAVALFDGPESPVTQTFGLGIHRAPTPEELSELERFFQERGAPVFHEVSPLADAALWPMLHGRGYQPFEFTSILYRPIWPSLKLEGGRNSRLQVRRAATPADQEAWVAASAAGWSEFPECADQMLELGRVGLARADGLPFLAELDGRAIAAGMLVLHEGVAMLAGASTVPAARRQGAQLALLQARLRHAAEAGCELALMGAAPGSGSQRNAERHGFRIAYTRVKWRLG